MNQMRLTQRIPMEGFMERLLMRYINPRTSREIIPILISIWIPISIQIPILMEFQWVWMMMIWRLLSSIQDQLKRKRKALIFPIEPLKISLLNHSILNLSSNISTNLYSLFISLLVSTMLCYLTFPIYQRITQLSIILSCAY